jgi:subtilisin-like proprotein convertase family protein
MSSSRPSIARTFNGRAALLAVAVIALALAVTPAAAQTPTSVYTYENTSAGTIPFVNGGTTVYTSTGGTVNVTDNGYTGATTSPSMTCKAFTIASEPGFNTIAGPVRITVPITAGRLGNLVIKLLTPAGNYALMSRPGYVEPNDTGDNDGDAGSSGDSSNLAAANPITFAMAATVSAENMGNTINGGQTVCADDGVCSFIPDAGATGLSANLATLNGTSKVGNWSLCIGDAHTGLGGFFDSGDTGTPTFGDWTLNVPNNSVDTCATGGVALARTFGVPASNAATVSAIGVGLNITHPSRGEVRAMLKAPNNAVFSTLLTADGSDTHQNYDVTLASNADPSGAPIQNDGDDDPVGEPYYARLVNVPGINFYSGTTVGNWTLYLCDGNNAANVGTLNRAKLILDAAGASTPQVCTTTPTLPLLTYHWADNGNNAAFTNAVIGGVTMALTSTRDLTGDADSTTGGRVNFTTQTNTFGNLASYFLMQFHDVAPLSQEQVLLETNWSFTPQVRQLSWLHLDMDWNPGATAGWEDYVRVLGKDSQGNEIPYAVTPVNAAPSFELSGDIIQGDTGNIDDASTLGNANYVYNGPIATVQTQYMVGDDWATPAEQRIGIGDPTFCAFDFGDAPDTYHTTLAANGPKHVLGARKLWLGVNPPDGESDVTPTAAASADNLAAIGIVNDEDGAPVNDAGQVLANFPACPNNGTYTVKVLVNNQSGATGYLYGYIDWSRAGNFSAAVDRSALVTVPTGTNNTVVAVTWTGLPANCGGTAASYARFRFTTDQAHAQTPVDSGPTDFAPDGEVEDYQLIAGTLPVTIARVASSAGDGGLTVSWTSASEAANAGFALWGRSATQDWKLLTEVKTKNPDSFSPQHYQARIAEAGIQEIKIEDVSLLGGERRPHGPFKVGEVAGVEPVGSKINWTRVRAESGLPALTGFGVQAAGISPVLRKGPSGAREGILQVRQEGIQRVSYEDLLAGGIDLVGIPAVRIALVDNGVGVPRHVVTAGATFGPGSFIEFYANPQLTLASPFDAFELRVDPDKAVPVASLPPGAGGIGVTTVEDVYRPDHAYSYSAANGDPFYDQGLLAWGGPASTTRTFDLPNLTDGPVELDLKTWGYGDWPGTEPPDHHVVALLNGTQIADSRFDGITPYEPKVDVTSLVQSTGNTLEVRVPGDTGYAFDYVALEGYSVKYPRQTVALGGKFKGTVDAGFAIGGFADGETVTIWRHDGTSWQRGEQVASGGQVPSPNGEVHAATAAAILKPGVSASVPQAERFSKAEYVIVTHPAFKDAVADLVALEQSRGFTTEVVTVDKIYAAYSDHAPSAEALHKFLTASIAQGKLRYVLLVGADTTDPYNHLGAGSVSFVPTLYLPFVQYINFSPTDEALVDVDGDGVGEVPIGRLPVRTPAELAAVVAKLRTWEQNVSTTSLTALLAAGASDGSNALTTLDRTYQGSLDTWNATVAPVDEMGAQPVRAAVLAAMNAGTPLVSYVGHSSTGQWDSSALLVWQDVAAFTNTGKPNLIAQWGCWNSYYVEPGSQSLSAQMLITPDAGAAGAIGATTLTSDASHQLLGNLFFAQVNHGAVTLGDAFHAAKVELSHQSDARDATLGMALFGDPAMSLPHSK